MGGLDQLDNNGLELNKERLQDQPATACMPSIIKIAIFLNYVKAFQI